MPMLPGASTHGAGSFPNDKVGEFFNRHFINMKLDMEAGEGLTFRKTYPVSAFPTLFFINGDGEVVDKVRALEYRRLPRGSAKKCLPIVRQQRRIRGGIRKKATATRNWSTNTSGAEQSQQTQPTRVANDYIDKQKDLSTEFNLRFIMEAQYQIRFKDFLHDDGQTQRDRSSRWGRVVQKQIYSACHRPQMREFGMEDLLDEAVDKMKRHYRRGRKPSSCLLKWISTPCRRCQKFSKRARSTPKSGSKATPTS